MFTEKHLNFDIVGSDDGISTDAESLCSYDSGPMSRVYYQDTMSISSADYDSAICSPKSLTLERDFITHLTIEDVTGKDTSAGQSQVLISEAGSEADTTADDVTLASQVSTDTILCDSETDTEDEGEAEGEARVRSGTLLATD